MTGLGLAADAFAQRCAPWTRDQGVDPIGTAGTYDTVLLVESPQPWPDDVGAIPALADAAGRDPRVRVLAVVPRESDDSGLMRVVRWTRTEPSGYTGLELRVAANDLPGLLAALVDDPAGEHPGTVGEAPPELLVCAHGRRDPCCGKDGTLLSVEVANRYPGVRTWRCSHTGGHRFAATGITFPDGRVWAYLDTAVLDRIVDRHDPVGLRGHYRGSLALGPWAQVVERELLERFGWAWVDAHRLTSTTAVADDGRSATVRLTWEGPAGGGAAEAAVVVARDVPVLVCGEPPEHATKSSAELALAALDIV
jgi:hypothetical protein